MKVEKVHKGIRYTLSNENLEVGDKVYPIARGRCLPDGGWILHHLDFRYLMSGFPNDPHVIKDLNYSGGKQGKPYQVQTDRGYSPIEIYYKIVKVERKEEKSNTHFISTEWVEFDLSDL